MLTKKEKKKLDKQADKFNRDYNKKFRVHNGDVVLRKGGKVVMRGKKGKKKKSLLKRIFG